MAKALVITTNGGLIVTDLTTLNSMQAVVGGLIEPVSAHGILDVFVNEEGLIFDLPGNRLAREVLDTYLDGGVSWTPRGDCFLIGPVNSEGEATDLDDRVIDHAKSCAIRYR